MQSLPFEGRVFERLTVLRRSDKKGYWWCQCSCGSPEKQVQKFDLTSGKTKSCGCLRHKKVHGQSGSPIYLIWVSMRARCANPNSQYYHRYGGRGIYVCERWQSFENFYSDMGDRPKGKSLDRIDNDGPYAPWNCRWASSKEQFRNRGTNRLLTYKGKTQTAAEWAEEIGVSQQVIYYRMKAGWSVDRIIETPTNKN